MLRRARDLYAARQRDRNPGEWGVSAEILQLVSAEDVTVKIGERKKVVFARRSDAFSLLHQAKRLDENGKLVGGISDVQHRASQRYVADWCERAGVRTGEAQLTPAGAVGDGQGATQRMIDAGRRIERAHAAVGRASARLLQAMVEPWVMRGEVRVWREQVRAATGESDRMAQGAAVRMALENLVAHYDEADGRPIGATDQVVRPPLRIWRSTE